jgi:hypothetical protein
MAINSVIRVSATVAGISVGASITKSEEAGFQLIENVPAANPGTLTTRTDDDTGVITKTLATHNITTGEIVDVYWSGGARYGMTAGTIATSAAVIPIDGGAGDNLPLGTTPAVTVAHRTVYDSSSFTGTDAQMLAAACDDSQRAHIRLMSSTSESLSIKIAAGEAFLWWANNGFANPITGDTIDSIEITQEAATATDVRFAASLTA